MKKRIVEVAVKVIVAALTAFLTAITTTSCMGYGPITLWIQESPARLCEGFFLFFFPPDATTVSKAPPICQTPGDGSSCLTRCAVSGISQTEKNRPSVTVFLFHPNLMSQFATSRCYQPDLQMILWSQFATSSWTSSFTFFLLLFWALFLFAIVSNLMVRH